MGRAVKVTEAELLGEVTEADLALLSLERGITAPAIKSLKDSHHGLARALASGMRPAEASIVTGYSPSRISILCADPAFKELLEFYRSEANIAAASVHDRMAALALDTTQELQRRLDEAPDEIKTGELVKILETTADRTGHGPSPKITQVNVNVGIATRLDAARERIKASAPLIEGTVDG